MKLLFSIFLILITSCKVTTGVSIEKDWQTDHSMKNPDLRTSWNMNMTREFNSWEEVWKVSPKENP